jgi:predicted acyl esterase
VAVLLAAAVGVIAYRVIATHGNTGSTPGGVGSERAATIAVKGARLSAQVVTPAHAKGRSPLIVMPASWGQPATEYHAVAADFAAAGYVVVAYAQRGFPASTGEVDFAGPDTQHDVRAVIDWALAHTTTDPSRIGLFGISYGAGVSLLAAAQDPRVKAVAALSTWADEGQTYDVNGTPSTGALSTLIGSARNKASFGPTVRHLQQVLRKDPKTLGPAVRAISADRSPADEVAALNRNHPAIMIANAYQDSIFPPSQLVHFFEQLTTPKRLQLAAGDHGGPELGALYGRDDETTDDALAWFDHYLRGESNGIESEGPIILHDVRTGALRNYKTWPVPKKDDSFPLGKPGTGASADPARTWQATITAGRDGGATSGRPQYLSLNGYQPPTITVADVKAGAAFVWDGPALTRQLAVAGTPEVKIMLAGTARTATVYAYLYDVGPKGTGQLMSMAPYTATGLKPNAGKAVTIPLQPTSWTVPSGDHVALVIDTVDDRYTSLTPKGAKVTVGSDTHHPASLVVPTA